MEASLISAIASAVSAIAAWLGIARGTREMKRWREQQQLVRRAEVGGEVLVATIRFLDGLHAATSLVISGGSGEEDPSDEHKIARESAQEQWRAIGPISNEFVRDWAHAETYLPETVGDLLKRVWDLRMEIWASQTTFFATPLGRGAEFFNRGWGSGPRKEIDALQGEARKLLRPIAQMSPDAPSRSEAAAKELASERQRQLPEGKA